MKRALNLLWVLAVGAGCGAAGAVHLDRVEVRDGAVLVGRVEEVSGDTLALATDYAGVISVKLDHVQRLVLAPGRDLEIPAGLRVVYLPDDSLLPEEREGAAPHVFALGEPAFGGEPTAERPRWAFQGGANLTGRDGNTNRFDLAVTLEAKLERPEEDRTNLYGRYTYGRTPSQSTADEVVLGGRYTRYLTGRSGLFVREELERDRFEGIAIRSTTAAGLTHRFQFNPDLRLETRSGLSFRYEDFFADGSAEYPGLDLGLDVNWRFVRWSRFRGSYTFLPALDDFADFLFEQDSSFNLPLDASDRWELRLGVASQYNNQPDFGRVRLDHRYYLRLIGRWQ